MDQTQQGAISAREEESPARVLAELEARLDELRAELADDTPAARARARRIKWALGDTGPRETTAGGALLDELDKLRAPIVAAGADFEHLQTLATAIWDAELHQWRYFEALIAALHGRPELAALAIDPSGCIVDDGPLTRWLERNPEIAKPENPHHWPGFPDEDLDRARSATLFGVPRSGGSESFGTALERAGTLDDLIRSITLEECDLSIHPAAPLLRALAAIVGAVAAAHESGQRIATEPRLITASIDIGPIGALRCIHLLAELGYLERGFADDGRTLELAAGWRLWE